VAWSRTICQRNSTRGMAQATLTKRARIDSLRLVEAQASVVAALDGVPDPFLFVCLIGGKEMMIEGIPDGWVALRFDHSVFGDNWIDEMGQIHLHEADLHSKYKRLIIRKIEKPKQYRPFANAAEFEPHRDRWVYSAEQRDDNQEGAESPEDGHSKITTYSKHGVTIDGYAFCFDTAFRYFVFDDDGSPFGVEVTE